LVGCLAVSWLQGRTAVCSIVVEALLLAAIGILISFEQRTVLKILTVCNMGYVAILVVECKKQRDKEQRKYPVFSIQYSSSRPQAPDHHDSDQRHPQRKVQNRVRVKMSNDSRA
jgi:hypothetical protein